MMNKPKYKGVTAVEAWRQMYNELKNATESRDRAYKKVITELREGLFHRTADLETAEAQLEAVRRVCSQKERYYYDVIEVLESK